MKPREGRGRIGIGPGLPSSGTLVPAGLGTKCPSPTPCTLLLTWAWLSPRAGREQAGRGWAVLTATVPGCPPWPSIRPRRAVLVATRPWHTESYSGGPSRSPGPCPLATALPGRTHSQPWAERAGGRQSGHPDSRTDQGSQSVAWWLSRSPLQISSPSSHPESPEPAWMLWTPPWRSSEPSACPEGPRASRVWPGELTSHISPTPGPTDLFEPHTPAPQIFSPSGPGWEPLPGCRGAPAGPG